MIGRKRGTPASGGARSRLASMEDEEAGGNGSGGNTSGSGSGSGSSSGGGGGTPTSSSASGGASVYAYGLPPSLISGMGGESQRGRKRTLSDLCA